MKSRFASFAIALLLAAATLCAQQATKHKHAAKIQAANGPASVGAVLDGQLSRLEGELVPLVEAMPEDKYDFAPTQGEFKSVRNFASQVKHVAAGNYLFGSSILGEKIPAEAGSGENGPENVKTKDEIVKFLKDSFAYAHKAAQSLDASNATAPIQSPFGGTASSRLALAVGMIGHGYNHYGQLVEYLRMNGIIPPASRPAAAGS